jgi:hypothetical protein
MLQTQNGRPAPTRAVNAPFFVFTTLNSALHESIIGERPPVFGYRIRFSFALATC